MSDAIPQWALERAQKLVNSLVLNYDMAPRMDRWKDAEDEVARVLIATRREATSVLEKFHKQYEDLLLANIRAFK